MKEILPANIDLQYLVFRGHSSLPALAVDLQKSCDLLQVCSNIYRSLSHLLSTPGVPGCEGGDGFQHDRGSLLCLPGAPHVMISPKCALRIK